MAKVTASYRYADGDLASFIVEVAGDGPDCIDDVVSRACAGLRDIVAFGLAVQAEGSDAEDEGEGE